MPLQRSGTRPACRCHRQVRNVVLPGVVGLFDAVLRCAVLPFSFCSCISLLWFSRLLNRARPLFTQLTPVCSGA